MVREKISAQLDQSRKDFLVTYWLIALRNPKIFIEAMFVIIPNWNQSSCVLPFKKKKLGRFAYADLKNLQNVFLSKKSKLRTIDTELCHLFENTPPPNLCIFYMSVYICVAARMRQSF